MSSIIIDGAELELPGVHSKTWEETGLEFIEGAHGARRRLAPPDLGVIHWTGGEGSGEQVFNVLRSRGLSVHFCIDPSGVVFQFCDPARLITAHAGGRANARSVGIEVSCYGWRKAGNPRPERERYEAVIHGRRLQVADFLPAQKTAIRSLVTALSDALRIPLVVPKEDRCLSAGELKNFKGWLGHYHLTTKKIDPGTRPVRMFDTQNP